MSVCRSAERHLDPSCVDHHAHHHRSVQAVHGIEHPATWTHTNNQQISPGCTRDRASRHLDTYQQPTDQSRLYTGQNIPPLGHIPTTNRSVQAVHGTEHPATWTHTNNQQISPGCTRDRASRHLDSYQQPTDQSRLYTG
ncbi:hypothetical protein V1264_006760 [Littorina saxatilis]|uniref:Uncharacterized protein n=1 Tax=Littorina saxatilis TaxID=31220 RepID=A0AAN9AY43_9CAEN